MTGYSGPGLAIGVMTKRGRLEKMAGYDQLAVLDCDGKRRQVETDCIRGFDLPFGTSLEFAPRNRLVKNLDRILLINLSPYECVVKADRQVIDRERGDDVPRERQTVFEAPLPPFTHKSLDRSGYMMHKKGNTTYLRMTVSLPEGAVLDTDEAVSQEVKDD